MSKKIGDNKPKPGPLQPHFKTSQAVKAAQSKDAMVGRSTKRTGK